MRTVLVSGGIETFVNIRESKWLDEHAEESKVYKDDLTEREKVIATQLVRKGVLNLHVREGKTYYTRNINKVMS